MAEEELIVKGLTGVDISLRIAGPGTRSYAFLTDWLLRTLLALGLLLVGAVLRLILALGAQGAPGSDLTANGVMIAAGIFAVATYLLYHPILEVAMRGRTPGLRKAGARIVTMEGATPGTGALLIRNLFRLIDSLPVCYVVGLTCCMFTKHGVRLGDMVAGTVLVLDESEPVRSLGRLSAQMQRTALPLEALQLIHDLLERWPSLEDARRSQLARALLAKFDPGFDPRRGDDASGPILKARLEALLAGPGH